MYIQNTQELTDFVARARRQAAVAIDTEFMREKTYYARLCLLQMATHEEHVLVDPLADIDITVVGELLADESVVKVFHSGMQDLEILYRETGAVTHPVFDTQIAASVLGFSHQASYAALVDELLGVKLKKGESFTDWAKRPLTVKQLEYAADDVTYLIDVYEKLVKKLQTTRRDTWVQHEFAALSDPATYTVDMDTLWLKIKRINTLSRRRLAIVREAATWRERAAQRRNLPRKWVLSDESIIEVARRSPQTIEELQSIRGIGEKIKGAPAQELLEAIRYANALPEEELPQIEKRKKPLYDIEGAVDLMMALVRLRAKEHDVSPSLLAPREEVVRLATGKRDSSPLLMGWRKELIGDELVRLLDGTVALRLKDSAIVVESTEP